MTEDDLIAAEGDDWAAHDHAHDHGGCDHDGPCDCHQHQETSSENVVLLTDLIPVTAMVDEHATCGPELMDEEVEDELLLA